LRLSLENRQLAEDLAEHGAALERANRELVVETLTDPLTGLANRRQLMNFMRAITGRCALLIVDVDHFKSYNDSFGHVDGDLCLVLAAEALQQSIRPGPDLVARQGGEEFALVLGGLSQDEALAMAELVRANVQALADLHPRKIRRTVTVSIGLAYRDDDRQKTNADLMEDADAALYEAKNSGRNRVCARAMPLTVIRGGKAEGWNGPPSHA
jgi:diguanylate cyclase (GGDEF)-like protein